MSEPLENIAIPVLMTETNDGDVLGVLPLPERFGVEDFEYDITDQGLVLRYEGPDGEARELGIPATEDKRETLREADGLIVTPPENLNFDEPE